MVFRIAAFFTAFILALARLFKISAYHPKLADEGAEPARVLPYVQAILTILGRRHANAEFEEQRLDLSGAYLNRVDLKGANLKGANLWGADLRGAHLEDANLEGAYLWGNLGGAHLRGANLRNAHLEDAHLRGANLGHADLRGAHLRDADLGGTDLENADLQDADLRGARLGGANLGGANLVSANLLDVRNLTQEQLVTARGDEMTKLPEGLPRPAGWTVGEGDDETGKLTSRKLHCLADALKETRRSRSPYP